MGAEPVSWAWTPLSTFEIDLVVAGKQLVVEIEEHDRQEVAESLARLANAVHPGNVNLVWHWPEKEPGG